MSSRTNLSTLKPHIVVFWAWSFRIAIDQIARRNRSQLFYSTIRVCIYSEKHTNENFMKNYIIILSNKTMDKRTGVYI